MRARPAEPNRLTDDRNARSSAFFRARRVKRAALLLVLCWAGLALTGCVAPAGTQSAAQSAGPNLALLSLPAYDDPEAEGGGSVGPGAEYTPVDLWLDGTQNMGGVNPNVKSMYPHMSRKFREGGFHYRYGTQVGWYENLLNLFIGAAGETPVRVLRYGNEAMPEGVMREKGLLFESAQKNASVWRDMHTAALTVNAGLFQQMSGEDMAQSFYSLGSPYWVNRLNALDSQSLENPSLTAAMGEALDRQIAGVATGESGFTLAAGANGEQCALQQALSNLDTGRLSVITVDPASVRRVTGSDATGKPMAFYEQLLREKGVFDLGLCVGVMDFQLDYMGQMGTLSTATFSEPLLWGRLILNEKKQTFEAVGVMPRHMLTLVIGTRARVEGFIDRLAEGIAADPALTELRGPRNGELTYAAAGQTVTQQPFGFTWNHTVIARPGMGFYTQHTEGAAILADGVAATGEGAAGANVTDAVPDSPNAGGSTLPADPTAAGVSATAADPTSAGASATSADPTAQTSTAASGLPLLRLTPDAEGQYPDQTFTVRLPITQSSDGATLDASHLSGAGIRPLASLLLSDVLPNTPENAQKGGGNAITYRDKRYLFTPGEQGDAFSLQSIAEQGGALLCTVAVDGARLRPGYYRLRLTADITGEQIAWETVPWIDGQQSVSATFTDAELYAWQAFTQTITENDRDVELVPRMFQHAWGGYTDKLYNGVRVPDFPPVYRAIRLAEMVAQFRAAAASDVSPLIRFAFEVVADGPYLR